MGFFKDIGNSISGAIKGATKAISIKNLVNLGTGNAGAVLSDVKNSVIGGVKGANSSGASSSGSSLVYTGTIPLAQLSQADKLRVLQGLPLSSGTPYNTTTGGQKPLAVTQLVKSSANAQFNAVTQSSGGALDVLIDYAGAKIDTAVDKAKQKIYQKPEVVKVMDLLKKEVIGYYWQEFKTAIIVGALVVVGLIYWFVKKPKQGVRKRTK